MSNPLKPGLIEQVQQNCNLSDAQYAGNYSMCTYLLKMREYYRWENRLNFSANMSQHDIGDWLVKREHQWAEIANKDYQPIKLSREYGPFETDKINKELISQGHVYSSGIGIFGKPHFFIGKLSETRQLDNLNIYISGTEFARDLVAPPATSIDNNIFIRQESMRRFIWERIEEWRLNKNKTGPMKNVLAEWNDLDNIEPILDMLVETETETMILHELGEIKAGYQLDNNWHMLINDMSGSRAEFFLRAVRDILADCLVTLPSLLEKEKNLSMHFYFANYSGLRKHLFPELRHAYEQWVETKKTGAMSSLIYSGIDRWQEIAAQAMETYKTKGAKARGDIEAQMHALLPAA
ncbi:MAG: Sfum_1244 family protein [Acidiferrobacterales bacterium]